MKLISRIQFRHLYFFALLGLLIFIGALVSMAGFLEVTLWISLAISLSISLTLFALFLGYNLYDLLLYACVIVFLFAGIPGFEVGRFVFLILLGLLPAFYIEKKKLERNRVALGLSLVALYSIGTSFLSYYPTISLLKGISLLLLAGFLLFLAPVLQQLHPRIGAKEYTLRMYLYFAIIIIISNGIFYLIFPGASFLAGRYRGWLTNPNNVGALCGIFFLPILWSEIAKHRMGLVKLGLVATLLLGTVELLASQSRAGILVGLVSLFVLIFGQKKLSSCMVIVGVIGIGLMISAILIENPESVLRGLILRNEIELEGSGRLPIWIETWHRFLDKPVFGSGLGVENTFSETKGLAFSSSGFTTEKANSYLGALEELGVVGVTLLVVSLFAPILKACWKGFNAVNLPEDKSNLILVAIVAAGLVNAVFEAWLLSVGSFEGFSFWIFASLLFAESDS